MESQGAMESWDWESGWRPGMENRDGEPWWRAGVENWDGELGMRAKIERQGGEPGWSVWIESLDEELGIFKDSWFENLGLRAWELAWADWFRVQDWRLVWSIINKRETIKMIGIQFLSIFENKIIIETNDFCQLCNLTHTVEHSGRILGCVDNYQIKKATTIETWHQEAMALLPTWWRLALEKKRCHFSCCQHLLGTQLWRAR